MQNSTAAEPAALSVRCCVVGGGPAGVMLGLLLARAGIEVAVLEKHADFFRDFRGDTVHPSTLQIMDELGILDEFLKQVPHAELRHISARIGNTNVRVADFSHIPGRCKYVAFMPQWDLLNFLAQKARAYPNFHLLMQTEGTDLVYDGGRVCGVLAKSPSGEQRIDADLVVGCDGRHSTMRDRAGMKGVDLAAPIDVLWLRLSHDENDPPQDFGNIAPGGFLIAIDRNTYYQCALVIRKDGYAAIQAGGLDALREHIGNIAPFLRERTAEIKSWDDVKLLTATVDRLTRWYRPGLLCIGDAAHAMSPVGGVGINLAVQDAVATANILTPALRAGGPVSEETIAAVQRRREFPMRVIQFLQVQIQNRVLNRILSSQSTVPVPFLLKVISAVPLLQRIPARIIGFGVRPEHVRAI